MENLEKRGDITLMTFDYDLTREQLVRFHLMFYCWVNGIHLTNSEMNSCVLLGLLGKKPLGEFIQLCLEHKLQKGEETTRNVIGNLCKDKQMILTEVGKKRNMRNVYLTPDIKLSTDLNTLLNIRCFYGDRSKIEIV